MASLVCTCKWCRWEILFQLYEAERKSEQADFDFNLFQSSMFYVNSYLRIPANCKR